MSEIRAGGPGRRPWETQRALRGATKILAIAALVVYAAVPASAASTVRLIGQALLERSGPGLDQTCRIELDPADGVTSASFVFNYDPAVLLPVAVYPAGLTADYTLDSVLDVPGTVVIHLTGGSPLAGTGDVAWVGFRIVGAAGESGGLAWNSATLNEGAIASTTVVSKQITVGSSDVTISVPDDLATQPSSSVVVEISATAFGSTDGIDLDLRYNDAVAQVATVQKTPLTSPLQLVANVPDPGELKIVLFGAGGTTVSGAGPLVRVTFNVTGPVGASMPLNLEKARISESVKFADDGGLSVCPANCSDGNSCTTDFCSVGQCAHDPPFAPSAPPALALARQPGTTSLTWSPIEHATAYDVVRGSLPALLTGGGDFVAATETCLEDDLAEPFTDDDVDPPVGVGLWYLVRPVNCLGPGTYDAEPGSQAGPRDAGIDASVGACP